MCKRNEFNITTKGQKFDKTKIILNFVKIWLSKRPKKKTVNEIFPAIWSRWSQTSFATVRNRCVFVRFVFDWNKSKYNCTANYALKQTFISIAFRVSYRRVKSDVSTSARVNIVIKSVAMRHNLSRNGKSRHANVTNYRFQFRVRSVVVDELACGFKLD